MNATTSLISELEAAIQSGSKEKRVETLRRVTDLFLVGADRFNETQIDVFDDVLGLLIQRIESKALVELSRRLAPIDNAPTEVVRRLANDDEIAIAGPVLSRSARLTTSDLVEIATTKGQEHLLAITGRRRLEEPVTDVLVDRGNREVIRKLVSNTGASFSDTGFAGLAKRAENDQSLIEQLGRRLDMPVRLFRELLLRATEAVKSRLLSSANPAIQAEVRRVLTKASEDVGREAAIGRDREASQRLVLLMHERGELDEPALLGFARAQQIEEATASLSLLCGVPFDVIDRLMLMERDDALMIPSKAADLQWPTVLAVLQARAGRTLGEQDADQAEAEYKRLSRSTAQRVLRFWQVRRTAGEHATEPLSAFDREGQRIAEGLK